MAHELPTDIDVVVGIPRSGLLAANLLCLHLDLPMTDVDGLCRGELIATGNRHGTSVSFDEIDTVLVIDDSVWTGTQMTETRGRLAAEEFPFDIEYAATYVNWDNREHVDYWAESVPGPRVFEWNVMHHVKLPQFCIDIDGVLCRDPTSEENDDGEQYRRFIREVEPRVVPNGRIGWLVTCRLEKYREETERWLAEHGIEYEELVMMDYPDAEARRAAGDHAAYKARVYEETGASLFIESSPRQATDIRDRADKPVYCYETSEMHHPGRVAVLSSRSSEYLERFKRRPFEVSHSACTYLLERLYRRVGR